MNNNLNNSYSFDTMTGQPINQQPQQQSIQNININTPINKSPSNKNIKYILIVLLVIIGVVILGFGIYKIFNNNVIENSENDITYSSSFSISNNQYKDALFDIDGKQLTEFEFEYIGTFVDGAAHVSNSESQYGILSSTGKMIVEFGKYEYLYAKGPLFIAVDKEYNNFLINRSGKIIRQLDTGDKVISDTLDYNYVVLETDSDYILFDYRGTEILKIPVIDDRNIKEPKIDSKQDKYVSIFYNNKNYIVNINTKKLVITIEDDVIYNVDRVNKNNENEIILFAHKEIGEEQYIYKYVKDGKVIYTKNGSHFNQMNFEGNNVIFSDKFDYILDENGNNAVNINYTAYKDYKNYVSESASDYTISELYVNGSLKEKIKCGTIETKYSISGIYLLGNCSGYGDNKYMYYKSDGTRLNNKTYKRAAQFDENGYAAVSDDGEKFYLINLNGEKVSKDYYKNNSANKIYLIDGINNLYRATNEDNTKTIFDTNGKEYFTSDKINTEISHGKVYASIKNEDKYIIYDLASKKEIITLDSEPNMLTDYFYTSKNSKKQYYSYTTGKLFYEQ